ncbi:MAG TPA: hypothetical protein VFM46_12815 [Pseudomonadales bacterium]|nr:hypothetical protein [Pseudomonadales bacterium]
MGYQLVAVVIATAILSSATTLGLAYWVFKRYLQNELEAKLQKLKDDVGDVIEVRVRKGFLDGVSSLYSAEGIRDTTRNMAKTGVTLVNDRLNSILGKRRRDSRDNRANDSSETE